jgi:drug/metabolite transporter (DMT)-like permease
MPVVAVLWGVYDHEPLQWGHILFSGVILSGVWLVNKKD